MCSTERGTNTKAAMRAGRKMVRMHIINISREMIGIGRLIHPSGIRKPITGKLPEQTPVIHYPIITPFWVLTGKDKCVQET